MKTVTIHQPNFIPWQGYFYKLSQSDVFVILDDVQYTKNSFINRNKIKTPQGPQWVTIPVKQSGKFGQNINETQIANKEKGTKKLLRTVEQNYKKSEYFDRYFEDFSNILMNPSDIIAELNVQLLSWVMKVMGIETKTVYSSSFELGDLNGTDRLVKICKQLDADQYFSGFGGMKYQEEELFYKENIQVKVTDFKHPVYDQLWGDFEPNLSIIDLLFNEGPESLNILLADN
jgi:hypothetical protein